MGESVTIAAAAMRCTHDKEVNLRKCTAMIHEAGAKGVNLLVFPEVSVQGYTRSVGPRGSQAFVEQVQYYRRTAEPVLGPTTQLIQELARHYQMHIQVGMAERAPGSEVVYNSAVLVGPEGVVGVFRKVHNQFEWPVFNPGQEFTVFDTPLGRIGPLICYDLCFPETTRTLALKGAAIATMTTAWPMEGDDPSDDYFGQTYDILGKAAAVANQMWMVQANQVMRPPMPGAANYYGHSRIIAPTGKVVAEVGYEEGLAIASVDLLGEVERVRTQAYFGGLNLLQDRRPEVYTDR